MAAMQMKRLAIGDDSEPNCQPEPRDDQRNAPQNEIPVATKYEYDDFCTNLHRTAALR